MQETLYIIKPEALSFSTQIRKIVTDSGLQIRDSKRVALTKEDVNFFAKHDSGYNLDKSLFRHLL
jgi:nucleoside diphosphate kinase